MLMLAVTIHPYIKIIVLIYYTSKNWNGINIDTSEFSIDLFNYMRPQRLEL